MPAPAAEELAVVRYAEGWGYSAREWQTALRQVDWVNPDAPRGARRLKIRRDGDCRVWQMRLLVGEHERDVVLKVEPLPTPWALVRSWLGLTRHARQWHGAELLIARGFQAARPLAILRTGAATSRCEVLIIEWIAGQSVLELMGPGLPVKDQHALAGAVGRLFARFQHQGLVVRDPKPSNLIVTGWHPLSLALVDTVDVRRGSMDPLDITKAYFEPTGIGLKPRRTLMARALFALVDGCADSNAPRPHDRRQRVRRLWARASERVSRHGSATPADHPLRTDRTGAPPSP
ncbi:MAG: hypothetical protein KJZ65_07140 [Phycisphaerales bacterium]|nr:hypothetical protein [Phycisphaerales bacterium]